MFALSFDRFGTPEVLRLGSFADPHAPVDGIRIRVMAAGVSPVDAALRAGTSPASKHIALPHIPGFDAAGIVDEVGANVVGVVVGDEVFGAVDVSLLGGASAEFAVLKFWAPKPAAMPWEQAGAAATSIETATRALDLLAVKEGTTVLIEGATGGVGSVATQLAHARGARVIGTGRIENLEFLTQLGAVALVYGPGLRERIAAAGIDEVDVALDVAGKGSLRDMIEITGSPGSVVTISDFGAAGLGVRLSLGQHGGEAGGEHGLEYAASLFEHGTFHVPIRAFAIEHAASAHAAMEGEIRQGKIVLDMGNAVPGA